MNVHKWYAGDVVKSLELRVFVIAYFGHLSCRAKETYDSKSLSGLSAFKVITNEVGHGISLPRSKDNLATRPAS